MSTPAAVPACDDKARLIRAYTFATDDYNRTVQILSTRLGVISKAEYETIRAFAEHARGVAEGARSALDRHTAEHGC